MSEKITVLGTLLFRNEEEILEEFLEHHLSRGVDYFIATDNLSDDKSREIMEKNDRVIRIIDEPADNYDQKRWLTRMSRIGHEMGAKWIIHFDADEFWYGLPLLHQPNRFRGVGAIQVMVEYEHIPTPGMEFGKFTREHMPYCKRKKNALPKCIHRAGPNVKIHHGNHWVGQVPGKQLKDNKLFCRHHYPIRSFGHFEQKVKLGGGAILNHPGPKNEGARWRKWYHQKQRGELLAEYNKKLRTEEELKAGMKRKEIFHFVR